jgi:hypothetical protein
MSALDICLTGRLTKHRSYPIIEGLQVLRPVPRTVVNRLMILGIPTRKALTCYRLTLSLYGLARLSLTTSIPVAI